MVSICNCRAVICGIKLNGCDTAPHIKRKCYSVVLFASVFQNCFLYILSYYASCCKWDWFWGTNLSVSYMVCQLMAMWLLTYYSTFSRLCDKRTSARWLFGRDLMCILVITHPGLKLIHFTQAKCQLKSTWFFPLSNAGFGPFLLKNRVTSPAEPM